jgi:uncharacterized membrane protein
MLRLLKGLPGHPSHPPLTDASIGAYTVGVAMLIAGALGLQQSAMAHGALLAISGGLLLAAPTALTGLLDWFDLERGTKVRQMATIHLVTMLTATLVFAGAWLAQRPGYNHGQVRSLGLALGLIAEAALGLGGFIGGSLVFVHGQRVLGRDAPLDASKLPSRGSDAGNLSSRGGGMARQRASKRDMPIDASKLPSRSARRSR